MESVKRIDFTASTAASEFAESLHQTGFAVLYNHPIKKSSIDELYAAWQKFFTADYADKNPYLVDADTQYGWVSPSIAEIAKGATVKDVKEFFNFYEKGVCPAELRSITYSLYQELLAIGKTLLIWLQECTPAKIKNQFSEPLPDMVNDSDRNLFRINYYPPLTGNEEKGAVRAADHTDIDLLTVLTAGTSSGLQALEKDGKWHDIPCEHGNLVINTGDMLSECSQGYFPSTVHRVLNPTGEDAKKIRMSCPMFIHPRDEVKLSDRHTGASYLHERLVELGLRKAI
jgi:isopenicillin N synthase-like dioxygenase